MKLSDWRLIRNWRARNALKKCAEVSYEALDRSESLLLEVEKKGATFRKAIEAVAAPGTRDGPMIDLARASLDERSRGLGILLQREISSLKTALQRKRRRADQFTVTLFGRTQAGKSTIREAITGGDGSTIGKGGQRTTSEVKEYSWHAIRILDTPGFGAYEGEEDRERAYEVVHESDLLLFLLSTDGIQDEVSREIAALNQLGKNILFVLNVKHDLTRVQTHRRQFLANPEKKLGDEAIRPHIERVKSMVVSNPNLMAEEIRFVAVHAQAAQLANLPEYAKEAKQLRDASNFRELIFLIEDELFEHGTLRRVQTIIGGTERSLAFIVEHLEKASKDLAGEAALMEAKYEELSISLNEFVAKFPAKCHDKINEHFQPVLRGLGNFIEDNQDKEDFSARWQKRLAKLKTEEWSKNYIQEIAREVDAKVTEFQRQYEFDREFRHTQEARGGERFDAFDWQTIARRALIITGVAASVVLPPGWGKAVGIGCAFLASLIPKGKAWREAVAANTKALEAEVSDHAENLEKSILDWFTEEIESSLIAPLLSDVEKMCQATRKLSEQSHLLALDLTSARKELLSHYPSVYPNPETRKTVTP